MSVTATAQQELIPGYVAIERLGAGGYGEVWKVDAPGGLLKAVKIIYGYLTEERATRELKSLQAIKAVRHPFLLSLERIEVVDGRLMIVTELADMSLVDRFEKCRQADLPGVPREELLIYLSDAADALDYMLQTHSLQHLDVKPENLLLTSGRAKVADFGLVKEIADYTCSLVGAMTPTYAAPEVFEGKASRFSDQYSLAIVYQEMLTATLPFPGRTAPQLAMQHARSRPQLGALTNTDRDIVGRALAKRPADRFPSCREFVDALLHAQRSSASVPASEVPARSDQGTRGMQQDDTHAPTAPLPRPQTSVVGEAAPAPVPAKQVQRSSAALRRSTTGDPGIVVKVAATNTDLAPPAMAASAATFRPAMFIGVGQTGMLALEGLLGRLSERLGEKVAREAFPMLVVETDSAALKHSNSRRLDSQDIVHVPLRAAHEYRETSEQLLSWLGRRWLYNLPKSGETQGMRPWGRLAVVDHAAAIVSKLRPRLATLTNGAAQQALEQAAPEQVRTAPPRIYLVGSCCGGTGGGALLELAYAVRNATKRLSADELEICAIITSATNPCPTLAQLATANAVSFLTELQHYARCGAEGARGADPQAALFENAGFPLTHAYFVDLGNSLTPEAFGDQVASLADYLYCEVATPLGAALDSCRHPQAEEDLHLDLKLRSFRMTRFDGLGPGALTSLVEYLTSAAANLWLSDVGGGKQGAERFMPSADENADSAAPDYALRTLLASTAAAWYAQEEARLYPPPAKPPFDKHQTHVITTRGAFLKELLAVRQAKLSVPTSPSLAALLQRVREQGREERITARVQYVAQAALTHFAESLGRGEKLSLVELLQQQARQAGRALFCELTPDAELTPQGEVRSSSGPALAYLEQRAQARYPFGCGRRTFLLAPADWLPPTAAQSLATAQQALLTGVDGHTYVCEELQDVSLGQVVQVLVARHDQILDVVDHLHTRIDIAWSEPARVEVV
jgi:serine/threonine protein kinase